MTSSNVLKFSEDMSAMTFAEGLAFIARTRRQLDRFELALPGSAGRRMKPEAELQLRNVMDDLEADIYRHLGPNAPTKA